MALPAGTRLGPYEVRSILGSGGMGDVYVARDTNLQRDVALKLLPPDLTSDPDRLRRFEQEARAASALNHPAIVAIYELGQAGPQPYISMELVEGQTLRQMLESGAMPPRRALHIAAQIADGLAKAHEAGIVHRDLKPENLMVSPDGFAKILDFGLAKLAADAESRAATLTVTEHGTRPGSVLGTVGYMSPEQAGGQAMDSRSDQFSFGLVLYEMLTGHRAFARPTAVETMSAIIREDPPGIAERTPAVPAPVRWIVERCLAKAPAERYASTRDLARDLAGARDHFSELTSAPAIARPTANVPWRREAVAWIAVALLGAAVLALVLRGSGTVPADPPPPVRFTIAPPSNGTFDLDIGSSPFALSPDGRHLAFAGTVEGRQQLWLRSFDSLVSRPIPGTEGASGPFWSPDGLAIGFFTADRMKRIPVTGGEATTICDARFGGGATWNRDGVIVFAPSVDSGLFRVAATGGTATPVTALDPGHEEAAHFFPVFLPDGRHFVFHVLGRDNAGMYLGSLDASDRKRLALEGAMAGFSAPDYLVLVREGAILAHRFDLTRLEPVGDPVLIGEGAATTGPATAVAVSASGALVYWSGSQNITQPTWVKRDGTTIATVGLPAAFMNVALSPDGRTAALERFDDQPGIWLLDVVRGTLTRSTFGKLYESTPVWAPDSQSFAFAAAREGPPNLFLKRLDAADDQRLFRSTIQNFPQSWSSDGAYIAYVMIEPKTQNDIWVLPVTGDRKPIPLLRTPLYEGYPRISPDGRWLAYVSNESGTRAVYVTRFPQPAGKWRVSTEGGSFPVWSRDGRELFYRTPDGRLMAVAVRSGSDFEAGVPTVLFTPRARPGNLGLAWFYDVASDGRFLVNMFVDQTSPPATVVLNWPAAIARREPER